MAQRSEAWRTYAAGSEAKHFSDFAREHLIQSEDRWEGKPLKLEVRFPGLATNPTGWTPRMLDGPICLPYQR